MTFELPPSLLKYSWSPPEPEELLDKSLFEVPYQPYLKSEKLHKAADWYTEDHLRRLDVSNANTVFSIQTAQEDASFNLVDHASKSGSVPSTPSTPWCKKTAAVSPAPIPTVAAKPQPKKKDSSITIVPEWKQVQEYQMFQFNKMSYVDTTKVQSLSAKKNETPFRAGPAVQAELLQQGQVFEYDRSFDRMTGRQTKPLVSVVDAVLNATTSKDQVLQKLVSSNNTFQSLIQSDCDVIYATSSIVAALMSLPRSVASWDIVVTKKVVQSKNEAGEAVTLRTLTFDKRHESSLDLQYVHETAPVHPLFAYGNAGNAASNVDYAPFDVGGDKDHPWSPLNLARETTNVARMFSQLTVKRSADSKLSFDKKETDSEDATKQVSHGVKYRVWKMTSAKGSTVPLLLVARTESDAHLEGQSLVHLRSLTEHFPIDPSTKQPVFNYVPWTTKFAKNQRGSVFTNEMRANSFLWARWCCEAMLSGVDMIKIGFTTRVGGARGYVKNKNIPLSLQQDYSTDGTVKSGQYTILGTQSVRSEDLATQLNLNVSQCWGILKSFADVFLQPLVSVGEDEEVSVNDPLPDGRYIIWRDPNATKVKVYQLPDDVDIPGLQDQQAQQE